MLKLMKKVTIFSMAFLVVISLFSPLASANEISIGKTFQTLYYDFDTSKLTQKEIKELNDLGWNVEDGKVSQTRKVVDGNIMVNGKSVPIKDGVFEISNATDVIEVESSNGLQTVSKNSDGEFIVVQEVDWEALIEHMDKSLANTIQTLGYGDKYRVGDWVHCNRSNGPMSDDVHYDKWSDPIKAIRNFTGSDCDLALLSWRKCDASNWCNVKGNGPAADCSARIGHKKTYHRH